MQQQAQAGAEGQGNYAKEWAEYYAKWGYPAGYDQAAAAGTASAATQTAQAATPQAQAASAAPTTPQASAWPQYQAMAQPYAYAGSLSLPFLR